MSLLRPPTPARIDLGLALLRAVTGLVFLAHGAQKLFVYGLDGVAAGFAGMGIPLASVAGPLVAFVELLGGLALIAGLLTRLAGAGLAAIMLGATLLVHLGAGFFMPNGYEFTLTLFGAAAALAVAGAGRYSLDALVAKRRSGERPQPAALRGFLALGAALVAMTLAACSRDAGDAGATAEATAGSTSSAQDQVARNLATFDTLDYVVFSGQHWDRLDESHADDIIVTWPDGHETRGIERHIEDLKALFVYAPDIQIKEHPIRFGQGEWTAVQGYMTGTFSRPMPMPDGTTIPPTGRKFRLNMATIGHWTNGRMDHEWLFWDNQDFMKQIGLAK